MLNQPHPPLHCCWLRAAIESGSRHLALPTCFAGLLACCAGLHHHLIQHLAILTANKLHLHLCIAEDLEAPVPKLLQLVRTPVFLATIDA